MNIPLEPQLMNRLNQLTSAADPIELAHLKKEVRQHVQQIHIARQQNQAVAIENAGKIASVLVRLLDQYRTYTPEQQGLIVGAARYFIDIHDITPDTDSVDGLDDDAAILNYVLAAIGKAEWQISF